MDDENDDLGEQKVHFHLVTPLFLHFSSLLFDFGYCPVMVLPNGDILFTTPGPRWVGVD